MATPNITIAPQPPLSPVPGDFWYNNDSGLLFIWYQDVDTSQWVIANPGVGSIGPAGPPGPQGPQGPPGLPEGPIGSNFWYLGTGISSVDTPSVNTMVATAAARNVPLFLVGSIKLGWTDPNPDYYAYGNPLRGCYVAVKIRASNTVIDGTRATVSFDLPSFPVTSLQTVIGFGTMWNVQKGTLKNVEIYGLTIDYANPDAGRLPERTQGILMIGVDRLRLHDNRLHTSMRDAGVSMSDDGAGKCLVNWPQHKLSAGSGRSVVKFTGTLPPNMPAGQEYYARPTDGDHFYVSLIDNGPFTTITGGPYSAQASGVWISSARGAWIDNCTNTCCYNNEFMYMRQGYFVNCGYNMHWLGERVHQCGEAIDIDNLCDVGSVIGCTITRLWGEAQPFDFSPVRHFIIANNSIDTIRDCVQLYVKWDSDGDYSKLSLYKYGFQANFAVGTPGVVTVPGCVLFEGMRVFFEYQPITAGTPPGGTAIYTTYFVRNPVGNTCNLSLTSNGALVDFSTAGTQGARWNVMADTPAQILPCYDVLVTGNQFTNIIQNSTDTYDPDTDIDVQGKRIVYLSNPRELNTGANRRQWLNGVGVQCQHIRFLGNVFEGGNYVECNECLGLEIDGLTLLNPNPGVDGTGVPIAALNLMQSVHDDLASSQSALTGSVRNVSIVNSQGPAVFVQAPGDDFYLDNLRVSGYNLHPYDNVIGLRVTRPQQKKGHKTFSRLYMKSGLNGPSTTTTEIDMRQAGVTSPQPTRISFIAPFDCQSAGLKPIASDLGVYVVDRTSVLVPAGILPGATSTFVPILANAGTTFLVMAASLRNAQQINGVGGTYTQVRLSKINAAGTLGNLSSFVPVDNGVIAPSTMLDLAINSLTNTATLLAPGETMYLEFARVSTGSPVALPALVFNYYALPFTGPL